MIVTCDECKYEFKLDSIRQSEIALGNKKLKLNYFICPSCGKLYKINLEDAKLRKLIKSMNDSKYGLEQAYKKKNENLIKLIQPVVEKKQNKVNKYAKEINDNFPGSFELVNDCIIYNMKGEN